MTSEIISKSFQATGITLVLDDSEDEMFIGHNQLLNDDQVMVKQVEQPVDEQDEEITDPEIDDKSNNLEENVKEEKEVIDKYSSLSKKLILIMMKMWLTLDGHMSKEKTRKTLLRLNWFRVYKSKLVRR